MTALRKLLPIAGVLGVLLSITSCSSPSGQSHAAVRPRVAQFVANPAKSIAGEPLLQRQAVVAFYEARKNEPAWDLDAGAASIRQAIADIAKDGLEPAD